MTPRRLVRAPGVEKAVGVVLAVGLVLGGVTGCGGDSDLTVYTAASLTDVLENAAAKFRKETGISVSVRPGASGSLSMSIENGAPADLFVSASTEWMDQLVDRKLVDPNAIQLLGWNRIVVVVPRDGSEKPLENALDMVNMESIAMGDPAFVPAGAYAAQALKTLRVWDYIQDRLVLVQDVRAALAMVERGEVVAGLVYASDAMASDKVFTAYTLPEKTHDPIVYPAAVILKSSHPEEARKFLDFLSGPKGKEAFRKYGFDGG